MSRVRRDISMPCERLSWASVALGGIERRVRLADSPAELKDETEVALVRLQLIEREIRRAAVEMVALQRPDAMPSLADLPVSPWEEGVGDVPEDLDEL